MALKFLTFSVMLLFATCSFATVVHTVDEPHKRTSAVFELFERDEDEDEDE